jgi:hypothetical protein
MIPLVITGDGLLLITLLNLLKMKLYFTTPAGQDNIQTDPRLSLGGYKALSPVPNAAFDNLFSEISQFMLSKTPEDEFIGLVLKNETGAAVENLWLWFEYSTGGYAKMLVAAVDLTVDAAGVLTMEHIISRLAKPLYADFYEANGQANAVEIGNLADGEMVGLWLCRQLIEGLADSVQSEDKLYQTDPANADLVVPIVPIKQEAISIKMEWGPLYYGGPIGVELI